MSGPRRRFIVHHIHCTQDGETRAYQPLLCSAAAAIAAELKTGSFARSCSAQATRTSPSLREVISVPAAAQRRAASTMGAKSSKSSSKSAAIVTDNYEYRGQVVDGQSNGFGSCVWKSGTRYDGYWHNNRRSGLGVLMMREEGCAGDRYAGEFAGNAPNGYGLYQHADGTRYEGLFEENNKHGFGISYTPTGRYEGQWKDGLPHGVGIFFYENGDSCEGYYSQGHRHGVNRYQFANGRVRCTFWERDVDTKMLCNEGTVSTEAREAAESARNAAEKAQQQAFAANEARTKLGAWKSKHSRVAEAHLYS